MVKIHIIGNVTADSVVKVINGKQVIDFSICSNDKYKNANGDQCEKKYFFSCSYWHSSTTLHQYIKKGQQVYIEGNEVTANGYKTSQDNIATSVNIRVTALNLLGSSKNSERIVNENNSNEDYIYGHEER